MKWTTFRREGRMCYRADTLSRAVEIWSVPDYRGWDRRKNFLVVVDGQPVTKHEFLGTAKKVAEASKFDLLPLDKEEWGDHAMTWEHRGDGLYVSDCGRYQLNKEPGGMLPWHLSRVTYRPERRYMGDFRYLSDAIGAAEADCKDDPSNSR